MMLEVCSCCGITEQHLADAVARLKSEFGDRLEVVPRKCLDVCAEYAAVRIAGEIMVVAPADVQTFEEKVRSAVEAAK